MDSATRRILELSNPWLMGHTTFAQSTRARVPRGYLERTAQPDVLRSFDDHRKAHLIIGPRQAGKSTLIWSVLRVIDRPTLYLNCEEPVIRAWCRSPTLFSSGLDLWVPRGGVLFFEEAQWLDEAGLFIKGLIDLHLGRTVVVTGSASYHLLARSRESLAGRATRHRVWPFSLSEITADLPSLAPAGRRALVESVLQRQLVVGGYPDAWLSEQPKGVLDELVGAFLLRDASDRFRIERPDAFRTLLRLAAGQVGDLVNRAEWAQILGIAASTVDDYLSILEETHVLRRVRPFIGGKRAELTKTPKLFFVDNGLRNAIAGNMAEVSQRADIGKLLESWVFSELNKAFPEPGGVRFWRTRSGAEVDFVVEPRVGDVVPIEVKAGRGMLTLPRSARRFIRAYQPAVFLMVYQGVPRTQAIDDTQVRWIPAVNLPERWPSCEGSDSRGWPERIFGRTRSTRGEP